MFVFGNFLIAVAGVLNTLLWIYQWILIIRALISFVNPDPYNPVVQFLVQVTEPVLVPIRRLIRPVGNLDFSVLVALLLIVFLKQFLVVSIRDLGYHMRSGRADVIQFQTEQRPPVQKDEWVQ